MATVYVHKMDLLIFSYLAKYLKNLRSQKLATIWQLLCPKSYQVELIFYLKNEISSYF